MKIVVELSCSLVFELRSLDSTINPALFCHQRETQWLSGKSV